MLIKAQYSPFYVLHVACSVVYRTNTNNGLLTNLRYIKHKEQTLSE
jgi:hypothetical protein